MSPAEGQRTYEAYCEAVGGKTWDNRPCPDFDALPERIRKGGIAAEEEGGRVHVDNMDPYADWNSYPSIPVACPNCGGEE